MDVRLQLSTAGESHGPAGLAILAGVPAGVPVSAAEVDAQLARRQRGYGRGGRQRIEQDRVRILAGIRKGYSTGAPIALMVENLDHENWRETMASEAGEAGDTRAVTLPRPGHADLAGVAKYGLADARDVLERSSARATAVRVAAGAVAREILAAIGASVRGRVVSVGAVRDETEVDYLRPETIDWDAVEASSVGVLGSAAGSRMEQEIDRARADGVSLGGTFEVWAWPLPPGLGGYGRAEERLDGRLAGALAAIPAVRGVEIGLGFEAARRPGPEVHDEIVLPPGPQAQTSLGRRSNNAGGLEGGMTNGMPLVLRAAMKPIPTMATPLESVDLSTRRPGAAHKERADVEAVAAARVVAEAETALVLADACLQKFGGDTLEDMIAAYEAYRARVEGRGWWPSS